MGGEVGRDIKVWRNLDPASEEFLDKEAAYLLKHEQDMLKKHGMAQGKTGMKKREIEAYCGDFSQLFGTRECILTEGKAKGTILFLYQLCGKKDRITGKK